MWMVLRSQVGKFLWRWLITGCVLLVSSTVWAQRFVVFTPTSENNTYWPQVHRLLQAVADDLHITVDIYEFNVANRYERQVQGLKYLRTHPKPDGAIFCVAFGNAEPLLKEAEALNIPVFIQGPLFPSELPAIGHQPRKMFASWVGYFYQDEFEKGYRLGQLLLNEAHARQLPLDGQHLTVAGVGGDLTWFGSQLRKNGLEQAVKDDPTASLLQVAPTLWSEKDGYNQTRLLLNHYAYIPVIWAASDQLGIGVAKAVAKFGYQAGKTILTGGLDLSRNGLNLVLSGDLTATVSGSILQYAEVLIYLYDYTHGIDFAEELGTEVKTTIYTATKDNAKQYLQLLDSFEDIPYAQHSKHLNPELTKYDMSVERLFNQRP